MHLTKIFDLHLLVIFLKYIFKNNFKQIQDNKSIKVNHRLGLVGQSAYFHLPK